MRRYDVTALGELLIDFTENGYSSQGNPVFEANPGGAPCNVLAMLAKLGYSAAFIGKVGRDCFGDQLQSAIREAGISAEYLLRDPEIHTTLAFVHTLPDGDRDFSFYRNPGADLMLQEKEIPAEVIQNSRMFHFGALSMTREPARQATKKAIRIAEEAGCICSFDPNLRPSLWNSMEEAKAQVVWGLQHCQILKISDNELEWLTGTDDYDWGADRIRSRFRIPLVLVSMGKNGSLAYWENIKAEAPAFLNNGPAETTGAGDTFMGCVLGYILKNGLDHLTKHDLCRMLTFANAAASIVTTRKGALKAMPEKEEILKLLHQI